MPKKTFYNLSEERQRQILNVAYEEFILNDYQSASLSRIIKKLYLAKGSFYRYFSSKKELYLYLLEISTKERFETLEKRLQQSGMTLFNLLQVNWQDKIEFEQKHPLESAFQYRVFRERYNSELGDMEIQIKREITEKVKTIIRTSFSHEVRTDIDPDLIAFLIIQVQVGMYDYLAIRFNDDLLQNIREGKPLYSLHRSEFEKLIESFTNLIKNGISK
jgi:AcrR family transcriptional regulator